MDRQARRQPAGCRMGSFIPSGPVAGRGGLMTRSFALLATVVLVLTTLGSIPLGGAHTSDAPQTIDIEKSVDGADTYMLALRAEEAFRIRNGTFQVTGNYLLNQSQQDVGTTVGIVQYKSSGCFSSCFMSMAGDSLKDSWDREVSIDGPVSFTTKHDPDAAAFASSQVTIVLDDSWFQGPPGSNSQVTYRIFITLPEAASIDVDVHLHLNKDTTKVWMKDDIAHDGGVMRVGDEWSPTARADTMAASAMVDGQTTVDVPSSGSDHFYAVESPSWSGWSVIDGGFVVTAVKHNTVATGNYGVTDPSGDTTAGTGVALGGPSGVFIVGATEPGPWEFFVNWEAGVGPQDMYLVGFVGEIA